MRSLWMEREYSEKTINIILERMQNFYAEVHFFCCFSANEVTAEVTSTQLYP